MHFFVTSLNSITYRTFLTHNFTILISGNNWPVNDNLKITLKKTKNTRYKQLHEFRVTYNTIFCACLYT